MLVSIIFLLRAAPTALGQPVELKELDLLQGFGSRCSEDASVEMPGSLLNRNEGEKPPHYTVSYGIHDGCGSSILASQRLHRKPDDGYDSHKFKFFDFISAAPGSSNPDTHGMAYKNRPLAYEVKQQQFGDPGSIIDSHYQDHGQNSQWERLQVMKESPSWTHSSHVSSSLVSKFQEIRNLGGRIFQNVESGKRKSAKFPLEKTFKSFEATAQDVDQFFERSSVFKEQFTYRALSPRPADYREKNTSLQSPTSKLMEGLVFPKKRNLDIYGSNEIPCWTRPVSRDSDEVPVTHFSEYVIWRRQKGIAAMTSGQNRKQVIHRAQDFFLKTQLLQGEFPDLEAALHKELLEMMKSQKTAPHIGPRVLNKMAARIARGVGVSLIHIEIMNEILKPPLYESMALLEEAQREAYAFFKKHLKDLMQYFEEETKPKEGNKTIGEARGRIWQLSKQKLRDTNSISWHLTKSWLQKFDKELFAALNLDGYGLHPTFKVIYGDKLVSLDRFRDYVHGEKMVSKELHLKLSWKNHFF